MFTFEEIKKSVLTAIWFMFLTFPIMVIRVNTVQDVIEWRWSRMFMVGIGTLVLSTVWRDMIKRKEMGKKRVEEGEERDTVPAMQRLLKEPKIIKVAVFGQTWGFQLFLDLLSALSRQAKKLRSFPSREKAVAWLKKGIKK